MTLRAGDGADALFGRQHELARLVERLDRAVAGAPGVVVIAGEPGIGKSRLADELARTAWERGVRVLRSDASGRDRAPFSLWAGIKRIQDPDESLVVGTDHRWAVRDALATHLSSLAPALLILEDLHWADQLSLWLLERLPSALGTAGVLFVATSRDHHPNAESQSALRRGAELLPLTGLDLPATQQLVTARAPGHDHDARHLWEVTSGNPLFLRELLLISPDVHRLPPLVSEVLDQIVGHLPSHARRPLEALAVASPATALDILAAAVDTSPSDYLDALAAPSDLDLIRFDQLGRPHLRHELIRAAVVDGMAPAERRSLHLALAAALEARNPTPPMLAEAARHRASALPAGDVALAAGTAATAMERLRAFGQHAAAAEVGLAASASLETSGAASDIAATVVLELADTLDHLGDTTRAVAEYERAVVMLGSEGDVEMRARAEVGACRHVNAFVPDPHRHERLRQLAEALPQEDSALLAAVHGRVAVLGAALPGGMAAAHRHGDVAVAIARRRGEPGLLADATADRHMAAVGVDGLRALEAAADEVTALGARTGRPDVELRGLEWQASSRLDRGDRHGANEALVRMELLAELAPSPYWRYAARVRRAGLHLVDGDRIAALRAAEEAAEIGASVVPGFERLGLELATRYLAVLLWQIPDDHLPSVYERLAAITGSIEVPFIQTRLAIAAATLGDMTRARELVARHGQRPARLLESMAGLSTTAIVAELAVDLADRAAAAPLRSALAPYADRLCVGNGAEPRMPIADVLGRLALLDGDSDAALEHLRDAVTIARSVPSPTFLAHACAHLATVLEARGDRDGAARVQRESERVAAHLGMAGFGSSSSDPRTSAPARASATLERLTGGWRVASPWGQAHLADSIGLAQLARLLALPGVALSAVDLVHADGTTKPVGGLGPVLDTRAKRAFRQRITELEADIDEARVLNDPARAERAEAELEAVMDELRRAAGIGGRDRPVGSGAERARVNATRSVRRAIAAIGARVPELGAHLDRSVRTGTECSYDPEPAAALHWTISA